MSGILLITSSNDTVENCYSLKNKLNRFLSNLYYTKLSKFIVIVIQIFLVQTGKMNWFNLTTLKKMMIKNVKLQ